MPVHFVSSALLKSKGSYFSTEPTNLVSDNVKVFLAPGDESHPVIQNLCKLLTRRQDQAELRAYNVYSTHAVAAPVPDAFPTPATIRIGLPGMKAIYSQDEVGIKSHNAQTTGQVLPVAYVRTIRRSSKNMSK